MMYASWEALESFSFSYSPEGQRSRSKLRGHATSLVTDPRTNQLTLAEAKTNLSS